MMGTPARASRKTIPDFTHEITLGGHLIAGTDEAGRAPLAGPVTAAAVILDSQNIPEGINDSKKLSATKREALFKQIIESAIAYHIEHVDIATIDRINILHASMLAMQRCAEALRPAPLHLLVDGNRLPASLPCEGTALVKGDSKSLSIAAASILAKTARDRLMQQLAEQYPHYGWERNAGYPTPQHLAALTTHGITPHHRRSFAPVKQALALHGDEDHAMLCPA